MGSIVPGSEDEWFKVNVEIYVGPTGIFGLSRAEESAFLFQFTQ